MSESEYPIYEGDFRPRKGQALIERRAAPLGPMVAPLPRTGVAESADSEIDLRSVWRVVVKWRWTILLITLIFLATVLTVTYLTTPVFRARLTLQIDREDIRVVKIEGVTPEESAGPDQDYYQTQYELLKSNNLAQRVINQLDLVNRLPAVNKPSPLDQLTEWLMSWWPQPAPLEGSGPPPEIARNQKIVTAFLNDLTVAPVRSSRLVKLYYDSPDPELAASILNTLARAYIDFNLERRFDASAYARDFLQERLKQIKARLEESEKEMVAYASRQGIINLDDTQNIVTQRLAAMNAALAAAEKQRTMYEAAYRQMLETRGHGLSQVLDSRIIQTLKESKAKLEAQYQDNLKIFKPAYPSMVQLRGQIDQIDQQINREVANIRGAITATYEAARTEETLLRNSLNQLKRDELDLQGRSIQLNILRREVDTNRELYNGLLQRFKEIGVAAGVGTNNISVVDEAKTPLKPASPDVLQNAFLGLVLGLVGGIGLAFLRQHFDDTIKEPDQVERLFGLPVLGVIPKIRQKRSANRALALIGHDEPLSAIAESYRSLCATLIFSSPNGAPRLLAVTSAKTGEGKSTTALSLAIQFAQAGRKVLLIDADLRNPSLHHFLGVSNEVGLTNLLASDQVQSIKLAQPTRIPNLFFIPSGSLSTNPAELLSSVKMMELLMLAGEHFDQVLVDSPPVMGLADALILGNLCDGTLLNVETGNTSQGLVQSACKRLLGARVHLAGVILTKQLLPQQGGVY